MARLGYPDIAIVCEVSLARIPHLRIEKGCLCPASSPGKEIRRGSETSRAPGAGAAELGTEEFRATEPGTAELGTA